MAAAAPSMSRWPFVISNSMFSVLTRCDVVVVVPLALVVLMRCCVLRIIGWGVPSEMSIPHYVNFQFLIV